MTWKEAIIKVLAEEGAPMHYVDITNKIIEKEFKQYSGDTPEMTVSNCLTTNSDLFRKVSTGVWDLVKSAAAITGSHVPLRGVVLACIETIGRKCFDAHDIYAFEPIFKACVPHCHDLEDALKHQLDELVKEGVLDTLPHDWYLVK